MNDPASPKLLTPAQRNRARQKAFRPIALQLGWLVFQWNRLHEALAELFTDVVQGIEIPYAIWHSAPNDRPQRAMLRAALDAKYAGKKQSREYQDVDWILKELEKLAGRRNSALHAPLIFVNDSYEGQLEIIPNYFFGNPRATDLRDKKLAEEFKWCTDHLARLANFAEWIHIATRHPGHFSWPDRPILPSRGQFASHAAQRRKSRTK